MAKYLKVGLYRNQYTDVFLRVPDGVTAPGQVSREILRAAVRETVKHYEWENDDGLGSLDWHEWGIVEAEEAEQFQVFDATQGAQDTAGEEPGDTDRDMADHEGWGL